MPVAVVVVADLEHTVTGDLDLQNTSAVTAFKSTFAESLAAALEVEAWQVNVTSVYDASASGRRLLTAMTLKVESRVEYPNTTPEAVESAVSAKMTELESLPLGTGFTVESVAEVKATLYAPPPPPPSPPPPPNPDAESPSGSDSVEADSESDDGSSIIFIAVAAAAAVIVQR